MKSKLTKKPDPEFDQDQDDEDGVEVDSGGPAIASAKKSKMMVIAASSILITVVIYFLFFKGDDAGKEKLEEVVAPQPSGVAGSESGRSPFEIDAPRDKSKDDTDLLAKPATPDVPTLPELPAENVLPAEKVALAPEQPKATLPQDQQPALLPLQPLPLILPDQTPSQDQQVNQQQDKNSEEQKTEDKALTKDLDPRYSPIIVFSGAGVAPALGVGYEKNIVKLKEDPIDQLQRSQVGVTATYIADRVHTIAQGKLLTAVLETAINTEVPGFVRAIISRDVYGESGNEVLIPKGSRLFGAYSSQITRGQGRVQIGWTRLIRPDGVDLTITFNASDQFGRSGIEGDVDNKYGSIVASSMLTSILAVGGVAAAQELLNNDATTTTTTNPTQGTTTTTGNATNQALYDVSKTIIDTVGQVVGSMLDVNPVIRVPQGTRITVIVNSDINVPSLSRR